MKNYDAVIVGAGPSGSTCAKLLKEKGFRVLVLEKTIFPREKLCAGMMTGRGEAIIDMVYPKMPSSVYAQSERIMGPKVYFGDRLIINSKYIHRNYCRPRLDEYMIEHSQADVIFGAQFDSFAVKSNNEITVKYTESGTAGEVQCKYLVNAQGGESSISKTLFPQIINEMKEINVLQFQLSGNMNLDREHIYILMFKDSFVNYLVPKDEKWLMGVGCQCEKNINELMEQYMEFIRNEFGFEGGIVSEQRRRASDLWMNPVYGSGNILCVGEAAGLWGRAGDGIWYGVESAMLAADSIVKSEEENRKASIVYNELINDAHITEEIYKAHGNAFAINSYHRHVDRSRL